ncbi:amino acid adenylation domain-containing protein [Legionella oakridgensis]|uniref:Amino acid adenylation domain protein n=2 Tax=Legionella oakridgensis TaxID=29423 RepID=W0BCL3_9GAMM|nr:amino acid adenylation domain-containing protein [Legionella oakridgensis]AHE67610.1 amino acid adenylation domain protein [Legionella oakridgensis ATCC 33761 = DSM 21215]ETO92848.1 amino acid adenylation domain protein [Legionella oakridgensis RV-2-2007]KTD37045.1 peptide synthetase, non-ribosomal [Legionella oakridgensis]STY20646.1 peptide synthetase, non-ribosomal [Legionella longbeachae]
MALTCCLIGEDSLLIQCGNLLLKRSHKIELVVSPVAAIQEWARDNRIYWVSKITELNTDLLPNMDYIFSVVNSCILPKEFIALADKGVINYHDSPLPKYAGLNSTTWAILNNEREHGVTWHVVDENIDAGDVVKQTTFAIHEQDTAFTLNLRCYEQAIQTFTALLGDLEQNTLTYSRQDLDKRSYFGRSRVLPNSGFIDWDNFTAEYIERMSRSLTVGHYHNNLGSLKIYINNDYFIIPHVDISSFTANEHVPGKVIAIVENAFHITTITQVIKINHFLSKEGKALTIEDMAEQYGITEGFQFMALPSSPRIEDFYSKALKNETYWLRQLKAITDHTTFSSIEIQKGEPFEALESAVYLDEMLSSIHGDTLKTILLSAILIYLYRLNDYENTTVSVLCTNYKELANQFGNLFSSFLPLHADWQAATSLEKMIQYTAENWEKAEKHAIFLTDVLTRYPELEGGVLNSRILINMTGELTNIELPENTVLYFQYDAMHQVIRIYHRLNDAYYPDKNREILLNMPGHISNILRHLLYKPHVLSHEFCFLTPREKHTLLSELAQGERRSLSDISITALFEKQVMLRPHHPAIVFGETTVSYSALLEQSEKVRASIHEIGLNSQSLIGIHVKRSVEMLAIILGILRADCVYVPLDTKYPLLKIDTIVQEANLEHLITSDRYLEELETHFKAKKAIKLYSMEAMLANRESTSVHVMPEACAQVEDKLAYIMFTSGTTGVPKGVAVSQRNVLNYCHWFIETTHFNATSIMDFSSSIAFDLSVPCTIAPLLAGGCIAICEEKEKTNPQWYLQHLKKHKITHTELTPGYMEMLLNYPETVKELVDLNVLLLGADVVHSPEVLQWLELCPNHQIVNEYGPTETTVSATSYFVHKEILGRELSVPIGRPAFNSTCYILDKFKNPCPLGMKGELYIGGEQVTCGYFGKPELTREKFVVVSFHHKEERCYRTGDLVGWLPDGNLQFYGRNDHQVKIQGYRIELAGIESVLLKIPSVHQAVVVVEKGHFKEKYLRAYLVADDKTLNMSDVKAFLSTYLPAYMIPKEYCMTNSIPLKENEKIDFEALAKQPCHFLTFDHDVAEELNEFEQKMMRIWQHAFNNTNIAVHDDFFDIGGDSLLALQIVTELKNDYHMDIPLYYLFEYPTIAKFASKIAELIEKVEAMQVKGKEKQPSSLIKLASGNYDIPLFFVHPVGGSVFWYKQLAKYLDGKYTIYGIQDISIDGHDLRFETLQAMASHYLQEIARVYSGERYCLAGASFGATVAFEMAHQLVKSHKRIEFLGLLDGWAEYPQRLMEQNTMDLLSQREDSVRLMAKHTQHLQQLEDYRKSLLLNYQLPVLEADVVLFKATEMWIPFAQMDDPYNRWQPFVQGRITVYKIPGNHETMFFDANAHVLAQSLDMAF